MNSSNNGILLTIGAYVVTMGVVIFIVVVAVAVVMVQSFNCSEMSRALQIVWATIAVVCVASVGAVVAIARRTMPGANARRVTVAAYTLVTLVSFVFVAFGLMVLFNC